MKKLILAGLLSVGVACACDTSNCKMFLKSAEAFKKIQNIKTLDNKSIEKSLEKTSNIIGITDFFCSSYILLSVNEVVSLQTKNPQFANINDDMGEQCHKWSEETREERFNKAYYKLIE